MRPELVLRGLIPANLMALDSELERVRRRGMRFSDGEQSLQEIVETVKNG